MSIVAPLVNIFDFASAVELESPFSGSSFNGAAAGYQKLATDPVGIVVATFSGIPAGLEIRIYDPDLVELAGIESCVADQVLSWAAYSPGNPKNNATIKIISTDYKIKDFPYTSVVGIQSIPVQMEPEPWYSNP